MESQGKCAIKRISLQVKQQMPCCCCVGHHLPDRRFHQVGRKLSGQTAFHFFGAGDLSDRPDLLHGQGNVSKSWEALSPGVQEDQIVVSLDGERLFRAKPEDASLDTCELACCLSLGQITISSFIVLHSCFSNEQRPVFERSDHIG